jgi:hypothetical protein
MANENEVILHSKYRFKPEANDKYVTLYFESSSTDIIIDTNIEEISEEGVTTLSKALLAIRDVLATKALKPVYDTSRSLARRDVILAKGQFGVESDTLQMKVGDGVTPWTFLNYLVTNKEGSDYNRIVANNDSVIITNDTGSEISVPLSELSAYATAPSGPVRAYVHILPDDGPIIEPEPEEEPGSEEEEP